jgi:hypothetical protein
MYNDAHISYTRRISAYKIDICGNICGKGTKPKSRKVVVTYVKSNHGHERKVCMSSKDMYGLRRTIRDIKMRAQYKTLMRISSCNTHYLYICVCHICVDPNDPSTLEEEMT